MLDRVNAAIKRPDAVNEDRAFEAAPKTVFNLVKNLSELKSDKFINQTAFQFRELETIMRKYGREVTELQIWDIREKKGKSFWF